MMNRQMNSASPAMTWLGGTLVRPRALRVMLSTTNTFVNAVHISNRAGATERTVSPIRMTMELLGLPPPTLMFTTPSPDGAIGAGAGVGAATATPAVNATTNALMASTKA